jgi:hypothetical protein
VLPIELEDEVLVGLLGAEDARGNAGALDDRARRISSFATVHVDSGRVDVDPAGEQIRR